MTSNFLTDIQLSYNQFTRTEKKVANYIIKNPDKVLYMSISDLSDACKVADASVYRFCRTVGLKGYQEFKMKLSLSLSDVEDKDKSKENSIFDKKDYCERLLENNLNALQETYQLIDQAEMDELIQLMGNARNIYFMGVGDSALIAEVAGNKFFRICDKVRCISDPHMQAMAASMATEDDLIIFISYSGSTKDNIYVAQIASESGVKMAAITRYRKSPLTTYTNRVILCGSNEGPLESGSMGAKISQLFVVDILFHEFYRRYQDVSLMNNRKTSKAVVEKLF